MFKIFFKISYKNKKLFIIYLIMFNIFICKYLRFLMKVKSKYLCFFKNKNKINVVGLIINIKNEKSIF